MYAILLNAQINAINTIHRSTLGMINASNTIRNSLSGPSFGATVPIGGDGRFNESLQAELDLNRYSVINAFTRAELESLRKFQKEQAKSLTLNMWG